MGEQYQYCVKLREVKNNGLTHYVWASEGQIQKIFDSCGFDSNVPNIIEHVIWDKEKSDVENKKEQNDKIYFNRKSLGSLEFNCKNEETANKCAKYWKLPQSFVKHNGSYTLNRD